MSTKNDAWTHPTPFEIDLRHSSEIVPPTASDKQNVLEIHSDPYHMNLDFKIFSDSEPNYRRRSRSSSPPPRGHTQSASLFSTASEWPSSVDSTRSEIFGSNKAWSVNTQDEQNAKFLSRTLNTTKLEPSSPTSSITSNQSDHSSKFRSEETNLRTIIVKNVPESLTDTNLRLFFNKFGRLIHLRPFVSSKKGNCVLLTFESVLAAQSALSARGTLIDGYPLDIEWTIPRAQSANQLDQLNSSDILSMKQTLANELFVAKQPRRSTIGTPSQIHSYARRMPGSLPSNQSLNSTPLSSSTAVPLSSTAPHDGLRRRTSLPLQHERNNAAVVRNSSKTVPNDVKSSLNASQSIVRSVSPPIDEQVERIFNGTSGLSPTLLDVPQSPLMRPDSCPADLDINNNNPLSRGWRAQHAVQRWPPTVVELNNVPESATDSMVQSVMNIFGLVKSVTKGEHKHQYFVDFVETRPAMAALRSSRQGADTGVMLCGKILRIVRPGTTSGSVSTSSGSPEEIMTSPSPKHDHHEALLAEELNLEPIQLNNTQKSSNLTQNSSNLTQNSSNLTQNSSNLTQKSSNLTQKSSKPLHVDATRFSPPFQPELPQSNGMNAMNNGFNQNVDGYNNNYGYAYNQMPPNQYNNAQELQALYQHQQQLLLAQQQEIERQMQFLQMQMFTAQNSYQPPNNGMYVQQDNYNNMYHNTMPTNDIYMQPPVQTMGFPYDNQNNVNSMRMMTPAAPLPSIQQTPTMQTNEHYRQRSGRRKVSFQVEIDDILQDRDTRSSIMIRNIPNKYTQKMLLSALDERHKGLYDFFYLPIDFKNRCNVGYAFINFIDYHSIVSLYDQMNGKSWPKFNSEKICQIAYARIQGKDKLVAHFLNSSLLLEERQCRPLIFFSDGARRGELQPFPTTENGEQPPQ